MLICSTVVCWFAHSVFCSCVSSMIVARPVTFSSVRYLHVVRTSGSGRCAAVMVRQRERKTRSPSNDVHRLLIARTQHRNGESFSGARDMAPFESSTFLRTPCPVRHLRHQRSVIESGTAERGASDSFSLSPISWLGWSESRLVFLDARLFLHPLLSLALDFIQQVDAV